MAKHYLDNVAFTSKTQGVNESLAIRDVEARALIQTNANAIAEVTAKEALDRADIDKNEKDIADLNKAVVRIDQKDAQQDNRLDDIEAKNEEQDNRLTAAETDITSLDARMDSAENNITRLDEHMTAVEAKNVEQDERLDRVEEKNTEQDNRITKNETDIAAIDVRVTTAETDITNIKQKDEEQDRHLTELDDKVAASTYEAGIGIYFGQGKVHTNINVEDEILDQINQNTIDIDVLKKKGTGTGLISNQDISNPDNPILSYYNSLYIGSNAITDDLSLWPENRANGIYVDENNVLRVTPTFWLDDPLYNNRAQGINNVIPSSDFTITSVPVPGTAPGGSPSLYPDKYIRYNFALANNGGAIFANVASVDDIGPVEGTDAFVNKYIEAVRRREGAYHDGNIIDVPFIVQYYMHSASTGYAEYTTTAVVNIRSTGSDAVFGIHFIVYNDEVTKPYIVHAYWNRSDDTWRFERNYISGGIENAVATNLSDGTANLSFS